MSSRRQRSRERERGKRDRTVVGLPLVHPRKAHRTSGRSNASRLTVSEYNARHYAATYLFGEIQRQRGGRSAPLNPDHGKPRENHQPGQCTRCLSTGNLSRSLAQPSFFPYPLSFPTSYRSRSTDISFSLPSLDFCATTYAAVSPYTEYISDTSNLIARYRDSCLVPIHQPTSKY